MSGKKADPLAVPGPVILRPLAGERRGMRNARDKFLPPIVAAGLN